ncbi:MAG: undecaprenyl/decaprenyl-phosphate alpha-N-acetylglucosaminyl 1-phosphate transferase [Candidatus Aminicenantes bacterium]|nr:undecaprenyl/decaprenyl-phosphate alpha-N-acetylglucosaminyl 1-phosphate transferase [Candidatus Aminicenantes bacterium]MBL7082751.1 undecaprenyl/decaprenyl-phosphate alpha-N-acetylglucosaminyl 1-phosphate transferase [Candidatus Aminicenantes bacterium]
MRTFFEYIHSFLSSVPFRWAFLLFFSFFLTFILTLVMRRIARKLKILDHPEERKIHEKPIPLLGGLAIYISYVVTVFLNFSFSIELKGIILGGTIILLIGLIDDKWGLPAKWKLLGQVVASSVLILHGIKLSFLPGTWWGYGGEVILTIIWIVGITNAVNFFDGMDGLAAGLITICSLSFFIVAQITGQSYLGYLTIALAGSCLAFLKFNFKPASIFLGDAGSTFLGFTLAGISVMGGWAENNPRVAMGLPILVLSIFIFDMVYITVARVLSGTVKSIREWIEYTGKDHLHHRLVDHGFDEIQTVLLIYLIAACLGIGGINLRASSDLRIYFQLIQALFIFIIIVILMLSGRKVLKK